MGREKNSVDNHQILSQTQVLHKYPYSNYDEAPTILHMQMGVTKSYL